MTSTLGTAQPLIAGVDYLTSLPDPPQSGVSYCAGYTRISKDKTMQGYGVERQLEDVVGAIQRDGGMAVIYEDNDTSATKRGVVRDAYQRMVADVAAGRIHQVYALDHTRLFRKPIEGELFMDMMEDLGMPPVKFIAGGEKDLSDYAGQFDFRVNSAVAARHVGEMQFKQRRAFIQKAQQGRSSWSWTPFGFNKGNKDGSGATLNEAEAAAIRKAYDDVLHRLPIRGIAKEWNDAGFRTPMGNEWLQTSVRKLLTNPRNAGLRQYEQYRNGKLVKREIVGDAAWPAIVSEDVWRGAVALMTSRTRKPDAWKRKHMLSGLLICGNCGKRMMTHTPTGMRPAYSCTHCTKCRRQVHRIDDFVRTLVVNHLADQRAVERKLSAGVDTAALNGRLAELLDTEETLGEALGAGTMRLAIYNQQMERVNAERDQIRATLDTVPHRAKPLERILTAADVADEWDAMDQDEQRAVVDTLFQITIIPGQKGGNAPLDPALIRVESRLDGD